MRQILLLIKNLSTGKQIQLDYAPGDTDTVVIDIKNRKVTSALMGNIINYLTNDTFLGDFVFVPGMNVIEVMMDKDCGEKELIEIGKKLAVICDESPIIQWSMEEWGEDKLVPDSENFRFVSSDEHLNIMKEM